MHFKTYLKIYKYINIVTWIILCWQNNISYKYIVYLFRMILTLQKLNNIIFNFDIIYKIILIVIFYLYKIFCY